MLLSLAVHASGHLWALQLFQAIDFLFKNSVLTLKTLKRSSEAFMDTKRIPLPVFA